ncbi:MAG: TerC family protein [Deltaproteobacteria bacterium]|nr:TerC family protein [Deltaproteobacteria bacterium]MCB9785436.1 TerC family protein [Deltaproteobacteria bacterium]
MTPLWIGFIAVVLLLLGLDLGVFNRRAHEISTREALAWTAFWIALSLGFNGLVYLIYEHQWFGIAAAANHQGGGRKAALEFFTAYIVEKSLSLDNIFVIALVFQYFRVPREQQHRVLFWGILGALVLRGVMIGFGIALIDRFDWIRYVFGGFLLITAARMAISRDSEIDPQKNLVMRLVRRWFPVADGFREGRFIVREEGRLRVTPLLLALVVVESTDVVFAVDSIPAVLGVTSDGFLVFTSNVCAILGLRALYFALAAILHRFRYIQHSLVGVLAFVGVKMIIAEWVHVSGLISLAIILGMLLIGLGASVWADRHDAADDDDEAP